MRTLLRIVVVLLPSLAFWPSALGKDGWMVLAVGLQAVVGIGVAMVLERPGMRFTAFWRALFILGLLAFGRAAPPAAAAHDSSAGALVIHRGRRIVTDARLTPRRRALLRGVSALRCYPRAKPRMLPAPGL